MTRDEVMKISPLGVYRIYWKSGGYSLASIGMLHNGMRWMAPANWTSEREDYPIVATAKIDGWAGWEEVDRVVLIEGVGCGWEQSVDYLKQFHATVYDKLETSLDRNYYERRFVDLDVVESTMASELIESEVEWKVE